MKTKFFISVITTYALIFSWQNYELSSFQQSESVSILADKMYHDIEIYEPILTGNIREINKLDRWVTFNDGTNVAITVAPDYGFIFDQINLIDFIE